MLAQNIKLGKLKNLKKGDKIKIGNDKYQVEEFDIKMTNKGDDNFEESKEIVLTKLSEKPKVLLKQKYVLRYNEKNKEMQFFRLVQEKENFPEGFKYRQRGIWTAYKEVEI